MKKTYFKKSFFANLQTSVWKPNFLIDKVYQNIFSVLYFNYTGDTP